MERKFFLFGLSTTIFALGVNLINIFGVVTLYVFYGGRIEMAVLPFLVIHICYALTLPISAKFTGRLGTRNSMIIGSLLFVCSYISLMFLNEFNFWPIFIWVIFNILAHNFFFLPMHYYFTVYTSSKHRGAEISKFRTTLIFAMALLPLLGGFASDHYGIVGLTLIGNFFIFTSFIPLLKTDNFKYVFKGGLPRFLRIHDVLLEMKLLVLSQIPGGFEYLWLIYVFLIAGSSFLGFGEILTAIALINFFVTLILGHFLDRHNRKRFLKIDSIVTSVSWLLRAVAHNPAGVILADSVFKVNENVKDNATAVFEYDLLSQKDHAEEIDERIVIREIVLNLVVSLGIVLGLLIVAYGGFQAAFVAGALLSLSLVLL